MSEREKKFALLGVYSLAEACGSDEQYKTHWIFDYI